MTAHHKRHPDFEAFDRIELRLVPRFKTSGLSGNEWRVSVIAEFFFKGEKVHEAGYSDMKHAMLMLGSDWVAAQIPTRVIEIEETKCSQPSCPKDATDKFWLKQEYSAQGHRLDPSDRHGQPYLQFCAEHSHRGDCSREDSDDNYVCDLSSKEPECPT